MRSSSFDGVQISINNNCLSEQFISNLIEIFSPGVLCKIDVDIYIIIALILCTTHLNMDKRG